MNSREYGCYGNRLPATALASDPHPNPTPLLMTFQEEQFHMNKIIMVVAIKKVQFRSRAPHFWFHLSNFMFSLF